ncbi:MAG: transglycosylase domain-containing protein [Candidatus Riflebacteria bacterium]|nr:transglycosylase domain-containing protein [Candidatus Riflebacteria bacterium]
MIRFLKKTILILTVFVVIYGVYLASEIYAARALTESKIRPMLTTPLIKLSKTDLSPRQLEILLKVEDPSFYSHNGIDITTPGAGLTTITQALVKVLYFDKFKPGIAKIKQILIAIFALNSMISKDDQLKLFLNFAYFGTNSSKEPILGFADASEYYFQLGLVNLSEDQFISLVAMLIAPNVFNPLKNAKLNSERVERIRKLVSGQYTPKGVFDVYYGKIPAEYIKELPSGSYFESYYDQ